MSSHGDKSGSLLSERICTGKREVEQTDEGRGTGHYYSLGTEDRRLVSQEISDITTTISMMDMAAVKMVLIREDRFDDLLLPSMLEVEERENLWWR